MTAISTHEEGAALYPVLCEGPATARSGPKPGRRKVKADAQPEKLVSFRLTPEADVALRPKGARRGFVKQRLLEVCSDETTLMSLEPGSHIHDRITMLTSAKLPIAVIDRLREIATDKKMSMSEAVVRVLISKHG